MSDFNKILLIDDFEGIILSLKTALLKANYDVKYCKNGEEGFNTILEESFDLIITDIEMPKMDGIKFIRETRKLDSYKTTPILVMTKNAEKKEEVKSAGATGWISKPINTVRVLKIINDLKN